MESFYHFIHEISIFYRISGKSVADLRRAHPLPPKMENDFFYISKTQRDLTVGLKSTNH